MMAIDRHEKIMQLLVQHKSISVKTLCDLLQASEATIRRDLTQLEMKTSWKERMVVHSLMTALN